LVGDFTGMIGDPTDKLSTRKKLSRDEVLANAKAWKEQVSKVLNFEGDNPAEIKFNSKWLDIITFKDLIEITSNFTVQQMLERDMFQERIKNNSPIFLHEFLYPVSVAIDCVEMEVDLEIGGNDQTFNMLAGRTLMKALKNKEKYVLATKLLVDKDGKKVGKTTGNALFLDSTPENFYAGIMSFPDETIELGFELLTEVALKDLKESVKKDPLNEKKRLAFEVVKIIWGEESAERSQKFFEATVQKKDVTVEIPVLKLKTNTPSVGTEILKVVSEICGSNSEAKRLLKSNAVDLNGKTINDITVKVLSGDILKVGKKPPVKLD